MNPVSSVDSELERDDEIYYDENSSSISKNNLESAKIRDRWKEKEKERRLRILSGI